MKKTISVIITDLDNTLFDWFGVWYHSFKPMIDQLIADSGLPAEQLIDEIKKVHETHGTSEYAFLIGELPSLRARHANQELAEVYRGALQVYQEGRKQHLKLYPGVKATLATLKEYGCLVVGYTESMEIYTTERVHRLGLDGILDLIYFSENHDFPVDLSDQQIRKYLPEDVKLNHTQHKRTPKGKIKPNPVLLESILNEIGAQKENTIYVGDNLMKDIYMAQVAGVVDVHARYGESHAREEYELLRTVTHWPHDHVEREATIEVRPSYVLELSFSELLAHFHFTQYSGTFALPPPDNRIPQLIDLWKKTVEVQQHFNDIELRIRSYAITLIGAILGAVAFAVKESLFITIFGKTISVAVFLILVALLVGLAFWFMDRHWYHRLLIGAVKHGEEIEWRLSTVLPEASLTRAISRESAAPIKGLGMKIHSSTKMTLFYGVGGAALMLLLVVFLFAVKPKEDTKPPQVGSQTAPSTAAKDEMKLPPPGGLGQESPMELKDEKPP